MAKVKTLSSTQIIFAEQALDNLFSTINSAEVKVELNKWFAFGLTGGGENLHQLSPEELAEFLDKIRDLSLALYCYQQEVQKGGDHEQ